MPGHVAEHVDRGPGRLTLVAPNYRLRCSGPRVRQRSSALGAEPERRHWLVGLIGDWWFPVHRCPCWCRSQLFKDSQYSAGKQVTFPGDETMRRRDGGQAPCLIRHEAGRSCMVMISRFGGAQLAVRPCSAPRKDVQAGTETYMHWPQVGTDWQEGLWECVVALSSGPDPTFHWQ